jgi:BASS family bile acid:Na+ symporter
LWKLYGRTLALMLAMGVGTLFPQAQSLSAYIPYLLVTMLFFAYLDISITRSSFHRSIFMLLVANMALPFLAFFLLRRVDVDLALVGFISAVTPTAIAAPVLMGFLRGRVDYVVTAMLLTNIGIAIMIPFALPLVAGSTGRVSTWEVLPQVLLVMFVPLVLAGLVRLLPAGRVSFIKKGKAVTFPIWLLVLFAVTSKASAFIQSNTSVSGWRLVEIALISLVICAVNFGVGAWIGAPAFHREASQALGQKNNSFTIWIALTYLNPLAALGPTFYVVYHNLYNGFQLIENERKMALAPGPDDRSKLARSQVSAR